MQNLCPHRIVERHEGPIRGVKSKDEGKHIHIRAEEEGRRLHTQEADRTDLGTRLGNGGDGIYLCGEAKVVEEEEEWMSAYKHL